MAVGVATAAGAALAGAGALAWGAFDPNSPLFGRALGRGPREGNAVYLTFDDGPNPTATARVLETLSSRGVPAAFFFVGSHVRRFPELARLVSGAGAGYEIGNHTETHVKLHLRGPRRVWRELDSAHRAIEEATGRTPRLFRAPHGYRNPFVQAAARRLGYDVIGWTFGVWDSDAPPAEEIRRRVRAKLRPGSIVLLHDGNGYDPLGDRIRTAQALPGILEDAASAGLVFRPLGDLVTR